jgi:hypothetical protein
MSIELLPASVTPAGPSQASGESTSLVLATPRAIATRASQISLVPSAGTFTRSSPARRGGAQFIYGTPVEDSPSDNAGLSPWQHVSGWAWNRLVANTAIAHYLSYAATPGSWTGQLIDLYA